mmetsp:Transcript_28814/g.68938  ORF Transcript_28814/g.68938 Transcript_28814/m.68938 type:complete len:279 (-) Transcript_28814:80-916(-)
MLAAGGPAVVLGRATLFLDRRVALDLGHELLFVDRRPASPAGFRKHSRGHDLRVWAPFRRLLRSAAEKRDDKQKNDDHATACCSDDDPDVDAPVRLGFCRRRRRNSQVDGILDTVWDGEWLDAENASARLNEPLHVQPVLLGLLVKHHEHLDLGRRDARCQQLASEPHGASPALHVATLDVDGYHLDVRELGRGLLEHRGQLMAQPLAQLVGAHADLFCRQLDLHLVRRDLVPPDAVPRDHQRCRRHIMRRFDGCQPSAAPAHVAQQHAAARREALVQ